jgi:hypothetical protein
LNLSLRAFPNELSRAQEMMREFIYRAMELYRVLFNLNLESAYFFTRPRRYLLIIDSIFFIKKYTFILKWRFSFWKKLIGIHDEIITSVK